MSLKDANDVEYPPASDPIVVTVPAGVLTILAKFNLTDPDPFALVFGEIVSGGSRISFDPGGSCSPAAGNIIFASTLADAGQTFFATVRGRDDDGHVTPTRSFQVTVSPPADAPITVTLLQCVNGDVGFQEIAPIRVLLPLQAFDFSIQGTRAAPEGPSAIPLVLSSSWQFPSGVPQLLPLPPGATVRPALPLGGIALRCGAAQTRLRRFIGNRPPLTSVCISSHLQSPTGWARRRRLR